MAAASSIIKMTNLKKPGLTAQTKANPQAVLSASKLVRVRPSSAPSLSSKSGSGFSVMTKPTKTSRSAAPKTVQSTHTTSGATANPVNAASLLSNVQLQVNLGDLWIDTVNRNDEMGSGCEPALTKFIGRLRLQGSSNYVDTFKSDLLENVPRNGENVGADAVNITNTDMERTINWWTKNSNDYALRAFNPDTIYPYYSTTPNLAADVAVGGAIYWEVNGNQDYDPDGFVYEAPGQDHLRDKRNFITDSIHGFFGNIHTTNSEFAKIFRIPFNYKAYHDNKTGANAPWFIQFSENLRKAVNQLGGESGYIKKSFNEWTKQQYASQIVGNSNTPGIDKIMGIHLMFMIPVSSTFYDNLVSANAHASEKYKMKYTNPNLDVNHTPEEAERLKAPQDDSGQYRANKELKLFNKTELLTTIKMSDDKLLNRTSTYVTFAFVPDKHPATFHYADPSSPIKTKSGEPSFKKRVPPVTKTSDTLTYRGGYDSLLLDDKQGWANNSSKWHAATPSYMVGSNIFAGQDPWYVTV